MDEAEWLACGDPEALIDALRENATLRKLRLLTWALKREIVYQLRVKRAEHWPDRVIEADLPTHLTDVVQDGIFLMQRHSLLFITHSFLHSCPEKTAFLPLIRDIFGNPFRPITLDPAWLAWNGGTVARLARAMEESGDFAAMPILADALEDASCTDPQILEHCRGKGPHVRGCWVVDALLGRT